MPRKKAKKKALPLPKPSEEKALPLVPDFNFQRMSNSTVRKFIYSNCLAEFISNKNQKPIRHLSRTELINTLYQLKQKN